MRKNRRSQKFINHWGQIRIASEVIVLAIFYVVFIAMILFAPPFATMMSSHSLSEHQVIAKELFILNYPKWPLFLLLAVFVGVGSILFSHRLVGPSYQLSKGLNELFNRNLGVKIKFRKFDFFPELQDGFNKVTKRWNEDLQTLHQSHQRATQLLHELHPERENNAKDAEIKKHLKSMGEILSSYHGSHAEGGENQT